MQHFLAQKKINLILIFGFETAHSAAEVHTRDLSKSASGSQNYLTGQIALFDKLPSWKGHTPILIALITLTRLIGC